MQKITVHAATAMVLLDLAHSGVAPKHGDVILFGRTPYSKAYRVWLFDPNEIVAGMRVVDYLDHLSHDIENALWFEVDADSAH